MAIRSILIHPDPRLRKTCAPIEDVRALDPTLIDDMFETMYAAPGIGLAAPQLGHLIRLIVMDCGVRTRPTPEGEEPPELDPDPLVVINPELVWTSEETSAYQEGCLSIPDQFEDVVRPAEARVKFLDRDGVERERHFDGLAATCIQHEIDHLNGKLFVDYLGPVKRAMITQKMKKLKRERAKDKARAAAPDPLG